MPDVKNAFEKPALSPLHRKKSKVVVSSLLSYSLELVTTGLLQIIAWKTGRGDARGGGEGCSEVWLVSTHAW